jgi:hypothetical protein
MMKKLTYWGRYERVGKPATNSPIGMTALIK